LRAGFVEESLSLLKQDPSISVVSCRRLAQNEVVKQVRNLPVNTIGGVAHRKADPSRDYGWDRQGFSLWQGYTFNPGLRRMSDYRMLGSFKRWGDETDASLFFKRKRMVVAYLTAPACETTGAERRLLKQKPVRNAGARLQLLRSHWRFRFSRAFMSDRATNRQSHGS